MNCKYFKCIRPVLILKMSDVVQNHQKIPKSMSFRNNFSEIFAILIQSLSRTFPDCSEPSSQLESSNLPT